VEIAIRIFVALLSAVAISGAGYFFTIERSQGAFAFCGLFVITMIFLYVTRFKKIRAFGIEAELWEQVQFEAEALTNKLNQLAGIVSARSMDGALRTGRFSSFYPWQELVQLRSEFVEVLSGAPNKKKIIRRVDENILFYLAIDYFYAHFSDLRKAFDRCQSIEMAQAREKFGTPIKDNTGWNLFCSTQQKKREPITSISGEATKLIRSKEIAALYEQAVKVSLAEYGDCLKTELGDLNRYTDSVERLKKILSATDFDAKLFEEEIEVISKRREKGE
jgi:hypothetical protein